MSALEDLSYAPLPVGPAVVRLPIDRVRPGEPVRLGDARPAHLEMFVQLAGNWPPVVITRSGHIVDGHYRYLAARRLRHAHLDCTFFDGSEGEAYIEAVRRNSSQGLPLTLDERRAAAARILVLEPDWSDRRVASLCGLAHETVGRVRLRLCRGGEIRHLDRRKGRDGKYQRAARVRRSGPSPVEDERSVGAVHTRPSAAIAVSTDAAFTSTDEGRSFVDWFEGNAIDDDWTELLTAVPLSRVYEVADEARRRAASWTEFASALSSRAGRSNAVGS
ncbi:MAG TPA: ParB/RepB/Spo0J family partition protein [Acidimicrobiales bacterium]